MLWKVFFQKVIVLGIFFKIIISHKFKVFTSRVPLKDLQERRWYEIFREKYCPVLIFWGFTQLISRWFLRKFCLKKIIFFFSWLFSVAWLNKVWNGRSRRPDRYQIEESKCQKMPKNPEISMLTSAYVSTQYI